MAHPLPPDVASDGDEGDGGPPDPHDVGDDEGDGCCTAGTSQTRPTDPLERFIQELENLSSMDGPDISDALADLPIPQSGDLAGISMQEAVEVCRKLLYHIWYHVLYYMQ